MKIGILTQPLGSNYGGIIQNFALQRALLKLGHEPVTIDLWTLGSRLRYVLSTLRNILFYPVYRDSSRFISYKTKSRRAETVTCFLGKHLNVTKTYSDCTPSILRKYRFEGIIVGSDQVWRPKYNTHILNDMFLAFAANQPIKRLAYAASFGVDEWEFNPNQTKICRELVKQFDAVSVREESAVGLCRDYFNIQAVQVLDPTLLLNRAEYEDVCSCIQRSKNEYLLAYVLDMSPDKRVTINEYAKTLNLPIKFVTSNTSMKVTIEEWLALFRDASFVLTDSFHGTVFSIIFQRNFSVIVNDERGASRFNSLLLQLGLAGHMISDRSDLSFSQSIEWNEVNARIILLQQHSLDFLNKNLCP